MAIKVQVAFQGGGAKLIGLLAAAEVLEEAHNKGVIRITRVAGTSAGSIAALILASGTGIKRAKEMLNSDEMRAAAKHLSKPPTTLQLLRMLRGKPLKKFDSVIHWLGRVLQGDSASVPDRTIAQVSQMRSDNQMELLIVSSDLVNRRSRHADPGDSALGAVEASSGMPFIFRTWRGGGYEKVDGGLCSNLPVDYLLSRESEYGSVLAISFQRSTSKRHDTFFGYLSALVETAISEAENRAKEAIPRENIFSISTHLTTLDFKEAVDNKVLIDHYGLIRSEAKNWLDTYLALISRQIKVLGIDPWSDQSANSKYALSQFGEYFAANEKGRTITYHRVRMTVSARSLSESANTIGEATDFMRLEISFSTDGKPVQMLSIAIAEVDEYASLDARTLRCNVSDAAGKTLAVTFMPMLRSSDSLDRSVAVCFHEPLPENSGPYTLDYIIRGSKLLRPLQTSGIDMVAYVPTSASGPVGELQLVVQVPEGIAVGRSFSGNAKHPRWMDERELPLEVPTGLVCFGCTASDVQGTTSSAIWHLKLTSATVSPVGARS